MPTLLDSLRERYTVHTDALRSLTGEIQEGGGEPTDEQDTRMRDLQTEMDRLRPRLEQQVELERSMQATAQVLARAPIGRVAEHAQPVPEGTDTMYRSAGEYLSDYVMARRGDRDAEGRLQLFMRAPANQTTADNPGIVPSPVVGDVLNFVDQTRPVVDALGIRPLPAYPTFYRPHVTQHTSVAQQTAEKSELASRKMLIERLPITASTFGGYVDLSLQDRDFTSPAIMGILINDLAGQYALETEKDTCDTLASLTASVPAPAAPTAEDIRQAIYSAAGTVYGATSLMPNVVFAGVGVWGLLGGMFPTYNPQNTDAVGLSPSDLQGATVVGLRLVISPQLPDGLILVGSTRAAEVYEQRVGMLQALEVSLLGLQVGYAGYFADVVLEPAGFCKITGITIPPVVGATTGTSGPSSKGSATTSTAPNGK